jgi:titin
VAPIPEKAPVQSFEPLTERLVIAIEKSNVQTTAGQTVKLVAKYEGLPVPQITWYLNDQTNPITASRKIKIEERPKEGLVILIICNVEEIDGGTYTVKAKTDMEELSAEATLKILSKPSVPIDLNVTDIAITSVTLNWSSPESDGGEKIKHYIIEKRAATRTIWQKVTTTSNQTYIVNELTAGTKYFFRVVAESTQGLSEQAEIGPVETNTKKSNEGKLFIYIYFLYTY